MGRVLDIFNQEILASKLKDLSPPARTTFAAAVATRLMPICHQTFNNECSVFQAALETVWNSLVKNKTAFSEYEAHLNVVMNMLTSGECGKAEWLRFYVENAGQAVAHTLRSTMTNDPQEPVWAAKIVLESVGQYICVKDKLVNLIGDELTEKLFKHPILQAEYSRQFEDLEQLRNWSTEICLRIMVKASENPALPDDLECLRIHYYERSKRASRKP